MKRKNQDMKIKQFILLFFVIVSSCVTTIDASVLDFFQDAPQVASQDQKGYEATPSDNVPSAAPPLVNVVATGTSIVETEVAQEPAAQETVETSTIVTNTQVAPEAIEAGAAIPAVEPALPEIVEASEVEQSATPLPLETPQEAVVTETKTPLVVVESAESVRPPEPVKTTLSQAAYLGSYLEPWRLGPDESIEFLFENAELSTLISYIEEKFQITFIIDDNLKPLPKNGKSIMGTKISFKTHAPLSKKDAWNIFVTFLDMAGLSPVPGPAERVYRLVASKDPKSPTDASRSPLPTLINVDPSLIPDNDTLIRYIYIAENTTLDAIVATIDMLRSAASPNAIRVPELNAVIVTDRGSNVRAMLAIIKELDQPNAQEGIAVVRLERADAVKAAKLYADFANKETAHGMAARILGSRKSSTAEYFPRGAKVIPEARTNSLIILGTREALEIITQFIRKVIDRYDDRPDTPRYIYQLKFLDAENLASVLTEALKFKEGSEATKSGGVRDGDKYFQQIAITAEPTTNKLIINADYDDYVKIHQLLESIDIEQPQVALRFFLLSIEVTDDLALGTQLRNKIPGPNTLLGDNVNFQTSGLAGVNSSIVERTVGTGATRLLGDLVKLASLAPIGSTVLTLGSDVFGVWGILNILQRYTKVSVISNPFMVTANKYPAVFKLGEIRRVVDSTIFAQTTQNAEKDLPAVLNLNITPQVASDGLITLDVYFNLEQFTDANIDSSNGNRTVRRLETSVIVADNEVLALGGLIRETVTEQESSIPVLGSIPIIGPILFKNRAQTKIKTSLLLLIQAEILYPVKNNLNARLLTEEKIYDVLTVAKDIREEHGIRDPINRTFFGDRIPESETFITDFVDSRNVYTVEAAEARLEKKAAAAAMDTANTTTTNTHTDAKNNNNPPMITPRTRGRKPKASP